MKRPDGHYESSIEHMQVEEGTKKLEKDFSGSGRGRVINNQGHKGQGPRAKGSDIYMRFLMGFFDDSYGGPGEGSSKLTLTLDYV